MSVSTQFVLTVEKRNGDTEHKQFASYAEALRAKPVLEANGWIVDGPIRQDAHRPEALRGSVARKDKGKRHVRILHETANLVSDSVNTRFARFSDEIGGNEQNPERLKRHSKREVSATWRKPRAMKRSDAVIMPAGRDVSLLEPSYQIERLIHNQMVQERKLGKALLRFKETMSAEDNQRVVKLYGVIQNIKARISLIHIQQIRVQGL